MRCALADRLRITKAEAGRRVEEAADLGERRALTGEPLAPRLSATEEAQRDGAIGDGHIKVIRGFFAHLPAEVDLSTREAADADLAAYAREYRPDELAKYAQRVMDWLHPDGEFSDEQRARKRGITLGRQEYDGMSRISGYLTPEARVTFEPVLAKLGAPGACNPDDDKPVVDQTPDDEAVRRDIRSAAQRNHDGLLAGLRALIASGKLGQHNGLPCRSWSLPSWRIWKPPPVTAHRWRLPATHVRSDPHGQPRSPLLGNFRSRKPLTLYHTKRLALPGAADYVVRQRRSR